MNRSDYANVLIREVQRYRICNHISYDEALNDAVRILVSHGATSCKRRKKLKSRSEFIDGIRRRHRPRFARWMDGILKRA